MTINGVSTNTKYIDGFNYLNNVLQFFPTTEGYVSYKGGAYNYVFNYTDHLGNVRLSYQDKNKNGNISSVDEILEENNYYPFGLKQEGENAINGQPNYKYKYQGQERQDELWLNWDSFKWRNYDYAIGRFMSIDPLAMDYTYNSPYAFQENKMGLGRELEGLELHYSSAEEIVNNTGFRPIVNAVKELGNSAMSLFSPTKPDTQKISAEKTNVSLSTDNGGNENPKTIGPALDFMNVTSVVENMGAFAGLPGGKSKSGMTDAIIGNTASNMKGKVELFKEGKDAATKVDDAATKGRKVLVEYVDGYRSVSIQNASEATAKKDSTNKTELGYKVNIERSKKDETNKER